MAGYSYRTFCQNVVALHGDRCWLSDHIRAKERAHPVDYSPGLKVCDGPMDVHHIFKKQRLKRECTWADPATLVLILEDGRNGMVVCRRHHDLLERALVVLRRGELPVEFEEFVDDLELDGWASRYWGPRKAAA